MKNAAAKVTSIEEKKVIGLKQDPVLWIAEGKSRFDTNWKNKEITWSRLLGRLKYEATQTQETQAEYKKASKADQDKIKDVGGFVGGTLKDGKRRSETVDKRYLLTFDLDTAPIDFVELMQLEAPYAWAIYSTHKHTPEKPRYRFIAPLDRAVTPDEYEAISRKIAEEIGIEYFDKTTAQPSRLMYWPSYSRGAEYVFKYNDDKLLSADDVLKRYPDWTDQSYWPEFKDEVEAHKGKGTKKEDPTKKEGPVGDFCRVYDVPAAIDKFLPDVYIPVDGKEDRYTFAAGTTSAGLVIYDDGAHCYSNHGTDPASGKDLNAFDLVRVHLYGDLDEEAKPGTPVGKLPSFLAMRDSVVNKDPEVIKARDLRNFENAKRDFTDAEISSGEWRLKLTRDQKGNVVPCQVNANAIIKYDPELKGIAFNKFTGFIELRSPLPWRDGLGTWKSSDDPCLYSHIRTIYNDKFSKSTIDNALYTVAQEKGFHPIKEYFDELPEWDKASRAEELFIKYLGADDTPYVREATRIWLLAAVKRLYDPGCKFDNMPVLSGPGGIGKSTLIYKLGMKWSSDNLSFTDMKDKAAAEKIQDLWIVEISELSGIRKAEVEIVKGFLSRQTDVYRSAYGRNVEKKDRHCVFIGTTNTDCYLNDVTGNRRFWPVICSGDTKAKAWDLTSYDVAQIWAEVYELYKSDKDRALILSPEAEKVARQLQLDALESDDRLGIVAEYLDILLPEDWKDRDRYARKDYYMAIRDTGKKPEKGVRRDEVSVMEVWCECFGRRAEEKIQSEKNDIAKILLKLGWKRMGGNHTKKIGDYGKQRVFVRG